MRNDQQKQAVEYIIAQLLVTVAVSALALIFGWTAAYSSLAGGLIATVSNAWFAARMFSKTGDDPVRLIRSFYLGEIYKILLTAALFILAFVLIRPVNAVALLGCYFLVHMTPAVVSAFTGAQPNESDS